MKFGKEFTTHLEETLPEWRDKFLCYKPLKKFLKNFPAAAIPADIDADAAVEDQDHPAGSGRDVVDLQEWFVRILNEELEKFNDFYVDKEEEFVIRFQACPTVGQYPFDDSHLKLQQELKERIEKVKEKCSRGGVFTSESEFSEEMMDIRKDFVTIHGEMVLLKNYSSLNFAGLVKILKKYDKRTGELLRLPFTQLALHQPFFTTEPLTRLVRECEANLELLFPLEAEVVQSTPTPQDQTNPPLNETTDISSETPSTLGEETMDIYRSTLAAMRTIRGLQKASSTYSPLSFSSLYRSQNDSGDVVTAENSASNSPATLQNEEEADQKDASSA